MREVTLGMGYDPRIGFEFLHPGPGWGGSCFPKDTAALVRTAARSATTSDLLAASSHATRSSGTGWSSKVARRSRRRPRRCAPSPCWGLTFKANTNDLRDSPAIDVAGAPR